ncbi:MAG: S9 family peptidase [Kangiellaceae bacterium]|nr:S9 family peptidase [Kangiellaceae bacterium]
MLKKIILLTIILCINSSYAQISVEDFFKFAQADSLRLSPDGKYIAVRAESTGKKEVYILDRKTKDIKQRFEFPQDYEAGSFFWVSDDRLIVSQNKKIGALDQPAPTGIFFAGNADGSKKIKLWPPRNKAGASTSLPKGFRVVDALPNNPEKVLVQMYERKFPGIYEFDLFTSRYRKIDSGPLKGGNLILDDKKEARVSIGVDEDNPETIYIHLKNENGEWELFNEYARKEGMLNPIQIYDNDTKLYVSSNTDGRKRGIYSLDLKTKELSLVHELKGDADIEGFIYDYKRENPRLVGIEREPDFPVSEFFDKSSSRFLIQAKLESAFPDKVVSIGTPTKDDRLSVVRVYNDKDAGTFYIYDNESEKLTFEMKALPWIDEKLMSNRHPISFKARDGLEIKGYLTLPNHKQKDLPMVLLVHGGPYGIKDSWAYQPEAQFFSSRGYAVLQVNYRGSGGRGRNFQYDHYQKVGMEMQDDLTDATLWAINKGIANKERICIYGGSYGGYASLMGVIKEPDLYQCAIGYVGAYDIRAFKYDIYHKTEYGRTFARDAWGYGNEEFMTERSPVYHVDRIKAPLLIIHGQADPICPMEHYEALTSALDKAQKEYESIVKAHEGHGFYSMDNRIEIYSKMESFLNKHIGM